MRKALAVLLVLFACGCLGAPESTQTAPGVSSSHPAIPTYPLGSQLNWSNWTLTVLNDNRTYTWEELSRLSTDVMKIPDLALGRTVEWKGIRPQRLGKGDFVTVINENGEVVSIPYNVSMLLALYMDGKPMETPIRLVVSLSYGCRCNWLPGIKFIDFVNRSEALGVYGEVNNKLWLSPRSFAVLGDGSMSLNELLDKADVRTIAKRITFITSNGTLSYDLRKIKKMNPSVVFEGNFGVPALGIKDLKGIKLEG